MALLKLKGAIPVWIIEVPLAVPISTHKQFSLNLNQYRNAHHHVLNKAKTVFHDIAKLKLKAVPKKIGQIHLSYTIFPKTRAKLDISNVCSIVDKFFSDALTSCGIIEDDNHQVVLSVCYKYGQVDPHNPRCVIVITPEHEGDMTTNPETPEEDLMKITINQVEIEAAITAYIMSQVSIRPGQRISIDLKATRGSEGYSAEIDIQPEQMAGIGSAPGTLNLSEQIAAARQETVVITAGTLQAASKAEEAVAGLAAAYAAEVDDTAPEAAPMPAVEAPAEPRSSLFGNLQHKGG
jgi:hypothetical protein